MEESNREKIYRELLNFLSGYKKALVMGVGSELRGDDAAGIYVVKLLRERARWGGSKIALISAGTAPESFFGKILKMRPSHMLLVDTVLSGGRPGDILLLKGDELPLDRSLSTHTIPIRLLLELIKQLTHVRVLIAGICPESLEYGLSLSDPVRRSAELLADLILKAAAECSPPRRSGASRAGYARALLKKEATFKKRQEGALTNSKQWLRSSS